MTYFDLNIPYNDSTTDSRLKLVLKSVELGHTAVAHNRSVRGVMSDRDICSVPLLPLPSALRLSKNLQSSAAFHRELLGVPAAAPIRQYTRLTVAVDGLVQCRALNRGNLVLRSYDLVAVRPTSQVAFDYICDSAEVDLVSIDFSVPLPFKMKFQSLQAAVKRGVYFEITYSPLIVDVSTRRQMIHSTQLLVQWTCGKNLIISSGAASVNEIRGPCDVANLSTLLGISTEHAKAALSKNCRSLLVNAVKKNQCYNNVIKVERVPSIKSRDSNEAWFHDENDWDHVSSSEGDALLDQIAKSFAAVSEVPKAKAIDFASSSGKKPSRRTQLKDPLPVSCTRVHPLPSLSGIKEFGLSTNMGQVSEQLNRGSTNTGQVSEQLNKLPPDCMTDRMTSASPFRNQLSGDQEILSSSSRNDTPAISTDGIGFVPVAPVFEESNGSDGAVSVTVEINVQGKASEEYELEVVHATSEKDTQAFDFHEISRGSHDANMPPSSSIPVCVIEDNPVDATGTSSCSTHSKEMALTMSCNGGDTRQNGSDLVLGAHDMGVTGVLQDKEKWENTSAVLAGCDMSVDEDHANGIELVERNDHAVPHGDDNILTESLSEVQEDKHSQAEVVSPAGALAETDDREKLKTGTDKKKCKRNDHQNCTNPNLKERFIELCLQQLDNGGRCLETLTLSYWVQIRKRIKKEFGKDYSVRRLKRSFEQLKKEYHICERLTRKTGQNYSIETNTIEWSPKHIEDSPHKIGLQADTQTPSVQQSKPSKEPVVIESNNHRSTTPHSESISAKVKSRSNDTVRTEKGCKNRAASLPLTPRPESSPCPQVKPRRNSPVKTDGKVCKRRRVAS